MGDRDRDRVRVAIVPITGGDVSAAGIIESLFAVAPTGQDVM